MGAVRYVLGIDQGGTKTHAAVADESGCIIGLGHSGGACHSTHGTETAMARIDEAVQEALTQSGIGLEQISSIGAGLTGIDWDFEKDLLTQALQKQYHKENVTAVNDCIIAMRAGTKKESGCVLCVGTGFNCAVRKDRENEIVYGFYIADEHQGGSALGHRAIQAVLNAHLLLEEPTALSEMILSHFHADHEDELLYQMVTGKIDSTAKSKLAPLIDRAAVQQDRVAMKILGNYGREIARYAVAGMKRLGLLESPIDVVLSGSVFKCKSPVLLESVTGELLQSAPNISIVNARFEPIVGAVLLALDGLGETLPETVYKNLEISSEKFHAFRY